MKDQIIFNNYEALGEYIKKQGRKLLLVCGDSAEKTKAAQFFLGLADTVRFSDFLPNPSYDSVLKAIDLYRKEGCGMIAAVGGGSAMDLAKCVKMFANMPDGEEYIKQTITDSGIPFIAVPTTAGTGSEATRYAIIYYKGVKTTVTHESSIPEAVLFDASVLDTLPEYHKKAAMLDALCHAVESYWSVHSTDESKAYAKDAIERLFAAKDAFLAGTSQGHEDMLAAANIAGKAINITGTTAGHAMCYKLTTNFGAAHGHAAAMCVNVLFPFMCENLDKCTDPRGSKYLAKTFDEIAEAMGCKTSAEACAKFSALMEETALGCPKSKGEEDFEMLKNSVNTDRLKNHPVALTADDIEALYRKILK